MRLPPVRYATTSDGYRIAYTMTGRGRPFIIAPLPWNDLSYVMSAPPGEFPMTEGLAERFQLVLLDGRGMGMSQRNLPPDLSATDFARDMEAVTDSFGLSSGLILFGYGNHPGQSAIYFAAAHPERVDAVIMMCSSIETAAWPLGLHESVARQDWELFLGNITAPGLPEDERRRFIERLARASTQMDYVHSVLAFARGNLQEVLPRLTMPFLWSCTHATSSAFAPRSR